MFPYLMKIINFFQDDVTGDGTTSTVLLIGEFLKQADVYISEGLHPRVVTEGFEVAKNKALEVLETLRVNITPEEKRTILVQVAKTSLNTKVHHKVTFFLQTVLIQSKKFEVFAFFGHPFAYNIAFGLSTKMLDQYLCFT